MKHCSFQHRGTFRSAVTNTRGLGTLSSYLSLSLSLSLSSFSAHLERVFFISDQRAANEITRFVELVSSCFRNECSHAAHVSARKNARGPFVPRDATMNGQCHVHVFPSQVIDLAAQGKISRQCAGRVVSRIATRLRNALISSDILSRRGDCVRHVRY